jgi:hypothetical protein
MPSQRPALPKFFIVDCPSCKAKVAAIEGGRSDASGMGDYEPYAESLHVGKCPSCSTLLAGYRYQLDFGGFDAEEDRWSEIVRVYPEPPTSFSSSNIPSIALVSLGEGERALQVDSNHAACLMFGRALEAVCRDVLTEKNQFGQPIKESIKKNLTLAEGIKLLRQKNIIEARLYEWSQELRGLRNIAAHADDSDTISRQDAQDMKVFVNAIIKYIYDLNERCNEYKARMALKKKKILKGS